MNVTKLLVGETKVAVVTPSRHFGATAGVARQACGSAREAASSLSRKVLARVDLALLPPQPALPKLPLHPTELLAVTGGTVANPGRGTVRTARWTAVKRRVARAAR